MTMTAQTTEARSGIKSAALIAEEVAAFERLHGEIAPNTDRLWAPTDSFLEYAAQHPSPRVRKAAERARKAVSDVRVAMDAYEADSERREALERRRAEVRAEIEQAERQLREAKAKARGIGIKTPPRGQGQPGGNAHRLGAFKRAHGRGSHEAVARPECPLC